MKEYTLLAAISVLLSMALDFILKTRLLINKKFWIFWAVMFVLIFIVNGFLTWRPVVLYGVNFYLGIRLFTIPLEDFLFGFGLITANIIIWEFHTRKIENRRSK